MDNMDEMVLLSWPISGLMHSGRSLATICIVQSEHHEIRSSIDEWLRFNTLAESPPSSQDSLALFG